MTADAANPLAASTPVDPAPQPVVEAAVQKRAEGGGA